MSKSSYFPLSHEKQQFRLKDTRTRKALDIMGIMAVLAIGVFGWSLPLLSALPAFNLFLFTMVGSRMASVGLRDSDNKWEHLTKQFVGGAFVAVLAGAALATGLAITGLAVGAAAALPYLFATIAGLGVLYTGASFFRELADYRDTPAAARTEMMKHKMVTSSLSFAFQLGLTAAIITAMVVPGLIIPGAQPFLLIAIPFAILGMAAYKFMYERQESKRILEEGNPTITNKTGYSPTSSYQAKHGVTVSPKPAIDVVRNENAVVASAVAPIKPLDERREVSLASNPNTMFASPAKDVVVEENLKTKRPGSYDVNDQSLRVKAL